MSRVADGEERKPQKLADDIDFGGLSLEAFIDENKGGGELPALTSRPGSVQPVEEYDKEKDKFDDLHRSILVSSLVTLSPKHN